MIDRGAPPGCWRLQELLKNRTVISVPKWINRLGKARAKAPPALLFGKARARL